MEAVWVLGVVLALVAWAVVECLVVVVVAHHHVADQVLEYQGIHRDSSHQHSPVALHLAFSEPPLLQRP